jgi:radical SAM family uncharacterized protein/radical SAM-linked protein
VPSDYLGLAMKPTNFLPLIRRPSRYLGNEINACHKDWNEASLRIALIFPDLYEIGMSHLGLRILYHIINGIPWALADRAYCPDIDLEKLLRSEKVPFWGLESRHPLSEFDVLAITLPYELCYTNILTILDLADIPIRAEKRNDPKWPIILGGGSCSVNPEPVADLFDAILVGDGEEALPEIAGIVKDWRETGDDKNEILVALSRVDGIYIPGFYRPKYQADGSFAALEPRRPEAGLVKRRIVSDLEKAPFPSRPLVPYTQIVHDRMGIEIARGCTCGCRFCQAGITYRPVRERSPQKILSLLEQALATSGWEELSLLSLSTGDYRCLLPLLSTLMDRYMPENVAVSLPSLRVGTLNPEIMKQIQRVRKTGFTLAPEAGSERLRRVINKGITEHDLIDTAAQVYKLGWSNIKLYFMIGLPTETMADVLEIAELAKRVLASSRKRGKEVTISVGTFVPKPHTPFQWERQLNVQESRDRLELLKSKLKGRDLHYKWHDPLQSFLEGVFSRGDRRLTGVLCRTWKMGARLDAWSDHLMPDLYKKAAIEENVELKKYIEAIDTKAPLPWGHILTGVNYEYLLNERENAWEETFTPDCRHGECQTCEVCDFKHIRPVAYEKEKFHTSSLTQSLNHPVTQSPSNQITYHLVFSKLGAARFLGHLELVHAFHRATRRAHIPVVYSHGFHPKPCFSFGRPIPLGTESMAEQFAITLTEHMKPDCIKDLLSREMPQGITISSVEFVGSKTSFGIPELVKYLIFVPGVTASQVKGSIEKLNSTPKWSVSRIRKKKQITTDLKQVVESLQSITKKDIEATHIIPFFWPEDVKDEGTPYFYLTLRSIARFNLKPAEVIGSIMGLSEEMMKMLRILKLALIK